MPGFHRPSKRRPVLKAKNALYAQQIKSPPKSFMQMFFSLFHKNNSPNVHSVSISDKQIESVLGLFKQGYKISEGDHQAFDKHRDQIEIYTLQLRKAGCTWKMIKDCFESLLKQDKHFKKGRTLLNPRVFEELRDASKHLFTLEAPIIEKFHCLIVKITAIGRRSHYRDARKLLCTYMTIAAEPEKLNSVEKIVHLLASLEQGKRTRHDTKYITQLMRLDKEVLELVARQQQRLEKKKCLSFWVEIYDPILSKNPEPGQQSYKALCENPLTEVKVIGKKIKFFVEIFDILSKQKDKHLRLTSVNHILKLDIESLEALRSVIYRLDVANCLDIWKLACYALAPTGEGLKNPKEVRDLLDILWVSGRLNFEQALMQDVLNVCYKLDYWEARSFLMSPLFSVFVDRLNAKNLTAQQNTRRRQKLSNKQLKEEKTILEKMHKIVSSLRLDQTEQSRVARGLLADLSINSEKLSAISELCECLRTLKQKEIAKSFLGNLSSLKGDHGAVDEKSLLEASLDILTILSKQKLLAEGSKIFSREWQALFIFKGDSANPWIVKRMIKALHDKNLLTEENICRIIDLLIQFKKPSQLDAKKQRESNLPRYALTPRLSTLINHVEALPVKRGLQSDAFEELIKIVAGLPLDPVFNCSSVFDNVANSQLTGFISKESVFSQHCNTDCRDDRSIAFHLIESFSGIMLDEENAKRTRKNLVTIWKADLSKKWLDLLLFRDSFLIDPEQISRLLDRLYGSNLLRECEPLLCETLNIIPYNQKNSLIAVSSLILESLIKNIESILNQPTQGKSQTWLPFASQPQTSVHDRVIQQIELTKEIAEISQAEGLTAAEQEMLLSLKNCKRFFGLWKSIKKEIGSSEGYCSWVLSQFHSSLDENHDLYAITIEIFKKQGILNKEHFRCFMRAMDRYTVCSALPGYNAFCAERQLFIKCLFELAQITRKIKNPDHYFRSFFEFIDHDIEEGHRNRLEALLAKFNKIIKECTQSSSEWLSQFLKILGDLQHRRFTAPLMNENMGTSENLDAEYLKHFEKLLQLNDAELAQVHHQCNVGHLSSAMADTMPNTHSAVPSSRFFVSSAARSSPSPLEQPGTGRQQNKTDQFILPSTCYKR